MRKMNLSWMKTILFGCAMILFAACDDSNEPAGKGEVEFEITDSPIDDASVQGVFVTVTDLKVNGQSVSGFSKQTIDLKAYQDGRTHLLGSSEMMARSYSNVTLVLDLDVDANGNSPGCYVLANNAKYKLMSTASGTKEIVINRSWSAVKDAKTSIVIDFDLRKSIRYSDDASKRFSFVSDANLNAAVRTVARSKSGTIQGAYQENSSSEADRIVVYAYKKGSFNATTETTAQGDDQIMFKNAVASALVKQSLTGQVYTLAYLPAGEYELHFAGYNTSSTSGRATFDAMMKSETSVNGSVSNIIKVDASATVNISSTISGRL